MKGREWVGNQWRRFVARNTVPGARVLLFSVIAHCVALVVLTWLLVSQRAAPVIVYPEKQQLARGSPGSVYLPPNARSTRLPIAQKNATRRPRKAREAQPESRAEGTTVDRLRERARLETISLIYVFKFCTIYGFSLFSKFHFAFHISLSIPS